MDAKCTNNTMPEECEEKKLCIGGMLPSSNANECMNGLAHSSNRPTQRADGGEHTSNSLYLLAAGLHMKIYFKKGNSDAFNGFQDPLFTDIQKCSWSWVSPATQKRNWNRGAAYVHIKMFAWFFFFSCIKLSWLLCLPYPALWTMLVIALTAVL